MKKEIKVPSPGESITEVQLANWLVEDGSYVEKDQEIAEIDSDKATLSISAESEGKIQFKANEGDTIKVGAVIGIIDTDVKEKPAEKASEKEKPEIKTDTSEKQPENKKEKVPEDSITQGVDTEQPKELEKESLNISPLARKIMEEKNISETDLTDFFKSYRFGKKDIQFFIDNKEKAGEVSEKETKWKGNREKEEKKMSTLRKKISERLVSVKNETAMLTTFNEVNMSPVMNIRKKYKDQFKKKFGIGLGFMSFFTKAITESLKKFPQVNAQIKEESIVYHHYADIGIAVSAPKGLMVPVIRNAETLSFAEIELKIKELAEKARNNKLSIQEMEGGTFTITNGGVFGSMLSTPILNPPQSAILGMHNIVERPVAVEGKVEIHPVMYVALSYDHRVIDGKDSVGFLVNVKNLLENPVSMFFGGNDPELSLLGL